MSPLLGSWSFPFWATFGLLVTGVVYSRGWRRLRATRPDTFAPWRLVCFFAGLLSLWIALASPLDAFGNLLLIAHMAQHLVLMSVAPPLLLLGAPKVPLLRGMPRVFVREALGPFFQLHWLQRLGRFLTRPRFAWLAFNFAFVGWHITGSYELALHSSHWHEVEHASFFLTALLFWWPVLRPWPSRLEGSPWMLLPYLLLADAVNTGLSAFLCFCGRVVYPTYDAAPRLLFASALQDQIAAGAFMWVIGSLAFLVPAIVLTIRLLSPRPRAQARTVPRPIRETTPLPFDLLRIPALGALLRARYGRQALQSVLFLAALAIVVDGFRGHSMGAMNLAGVLPWTYARALAVIALLVAGNFFCMACPFMLPREIGHRLGLATHRWPRWLRSKWLSAGLLILFFWSYEAFALWDHPARTAWIVIAYFLGAFVVDTFFRGASFCKYVCPIGQFNFVSSLISPLGVAVRSQSACTSCKTHDCIAGNERQRGCELQLFLPTKVGNLDCTLCMDCVKACPVDNIGLLAAPPSLDLLRDPLRSSIGRLSTRTDIAAVALVLISAAFMSAAAMVDPVSAVLSRAGSMSGLCELFAGIAVSRSTGGGTARGHVVNETQAGDRQFVTARELLPVFAGAGAAGARDVGGSPALSPADGLGYAQPCIASGCV